MQYVIAAVLWGSMVMSASAKPETRFVDANGVKLHCLDWGGQGIAVVFLHGIGDTAHVFDDIAPHFVDRFWVLALTRRGHGRSEKPDGGYDTATLADDLREFLKAMSVERAILIGHSMAGDEMTLFAARHPEHVVTLVYLDAAGDRSTLAPFPDSPAPPLESLDAYRAFVQAQKQGVWSDAMEANLRDSVTVNAEGSVREAMSSASLKLLLNGCTHQQADYSTVKMPTLSFHTTMTSVPPLPPELRTVAEFLTRLKGWQRDQIETMRANGPHVRTIELPGAPHYFFIRDGKDTLRQIDLFLAG